MLHLDMQMIHSQSTKIKINQIQQYQELKNSVTIIKQNQIRINQVFCVSIVIKIMTIQETIYKGFPIVEVYKYLGVLIGNKMDIQ